MPRNTEMSYVGYSGGSDKMRYTIEGFWKQRLAISTNLSANFVPGWSFEKNGIATFKEAPLTSNTDLGYDPLESEVILVSAPGAVGKSTLAREIASRTGAVYIDLAKADPVGGNSMSGGLALSGIFPAWQNENVAMLIDGLDEARLRVTQAAFSSFLRDIAQLSENRKVPTVVFGRTGAVQDAWLILSEFNVRIAVLEIGFYDPDTANDFAISCLRSLRPSSSHADTENRAVVLLLEKLRSQTATDGDRFAGYAPVLKAVADRVAVDDNPSVLIAQIEKGAQPVTLQTVATAILERERSKLNGLVFEDQSLLQRLYSPEEQLDRLVARIYGSSAPSFPPMSPNDAQTYSTALESWVAEHPFLNGAAEASSAVFDAMISIRALKTPTSNEVSTLREIRRGAAANPFLSEFYLPENSDDAFLPPEHIGIFYASMRARLSLGDAASLLVEGPENVTDENSLVAEVEISLSRYDTDRPRVLRILTEQAGTIKLGAYLEDIELIVPYANVEIGPGPEAVLIAPVSVQCENLSLSVEKLIVEAAPNQDGGAVYLEASKFSGTKIASVPICRGDVKFTVTWPDSQIYPWTGFSSEPTQIEHPALNEAMRRFRRFVTAFRSHSKGNLARYQHKIEHERMTKGAGQAVLKRLVSDNILTLKGSMYFLDADRLGSLTGATYSECMKRQFKQSSIQYIESILRE